MNSKKGIVLTIEEIWEKNLCRTCDVHICHNNPKLCPYQYYPDAHLCVPCKDRNNEIIKGKMKCYHTCRYREDKKKYSGSLDKYFLKK